MHGSTTKKKQLYKIDYPNSLYLNAAHREDRMYFNLDELDVEEYFMGPDNKPINYGTPENPVYQEKTYKLYAFSVSGEGTTKYTLQLAHTNNNELKYEIYEATQTEDKPTSGFENYDWVHYERHMESGANIENPFTFSDDLTVKDAYYTLGAKVNGENKNSDPDDPSGILAKKDTSDPCYERTYDNNTNVQENAVPIYWQANINLNRSDIDRNKRFHKYYILKVSWDSGKQNTKETDMIYLAVKS